MRIVSPFSPPLEARSSAARARTRWIVSGSSGTWRAGKGDGSFGMGGKIQYVPFRVGPPA